MDVGFPAPRTVGLPAVAHRMSGALGDGENVGWGCRADSNLYRIITRASQHHGVTLTDHSVCAKCGGIPETEFVGAATDTDARKFTPRGVGVERPFTDSRVVGAGGVGVERPGTAGGVVVSAGGGVERLAAAGRVVVARGVEEEHPFTDGRVLVTSGVGEERRAAAGGVVETDGVGVQSLVAKCGIKRPAGIAIQSLVTERIIGTSTAWVAVQQRVGANGSAAVPGGVGVERGIAVGGVAVPGGVVSERVEAGGRVVVTGGIGVERRRASGGVLVTGGVGVHRLDSARGVEASTVRLKHPVTDGSVEARVATVLERREADGGVFATGSELLERHVADACVVAAGRCRVPREPEKGIAVRIGAESKEIAPDLVAAASDDPCRAEIPVHRLIAGEGVGRRQQRYIGRIQIQRNGAAGATTGQVRSRRHPVIVPVPTAAHIHEVPFHCSTWLAAHAFVKDRFSVPLVPPPVRPLPLAVFTPVIVPSPPANAMSNSAGWLVVVLSLLSNVALNVLLATSARPLFVSLPFSHACTAGVTLIRMYWFLSAVVRATLETIVVPSAGALLASIVPSAQASLT